MKCVGSVFVLQHLTGWLVKINWEREREQRDLTSAKERCGAFPLPGVSSGCLRPVFAHPFHTPSASYAFICHPGPFSPISFALPWRTTHQLPFRCSSSLLPRLVFLTGHPK